MEGRGLEKTGSGQRQVVGSCVQGNECPGSITCGEIPWIAQELLASKEGFCSMELFSQPASHPVSQLVSWLVSQIVSQLDSQLGRQFGIQFTRSPAGKPKSRWEDDVRNDLKKMKLIKWAEQVQDRLKWKDTVEKAKTLPELQRHRRRRRRIHNHSVMPVDIFNICTDMRRNEYSLNLQADYCRSMLSVVLCIKYSIVIPELKCGSQLLLGLHVVILFIYQLLSCFKITYHAQLKEGVTVLQNCNKWKVTQRVICITEIIRFAYILACRTE